MLAAFICTAAWSLSIIIATWIDTPQALFYAIGDATRLLLIGGCIAALLGAIGGLVLATTLHLIDHLFTLANWHGALVGGLNGLLAGLLLLFVAMALSPEGGCDAALCWLAVLTQYVGIPAFGAVCHGWYLTRWIQKQTNARKVGTSHPSLGSKSHFSSTPPR
jgi:hypothetical protein